MYTYRISLTNEEHRKYIEEAGLLIRVAVNDMDGATFAEVDCDNKLHTFSQPVYSHIPLLFYGDCEPLILESYQVMVCKVEENYRKPKPEGFSIMHY